MNFKVGQIVDIGSEYGLITHYDLMTGFYTVKADSTGLMSLYSDSHLLGLNSPPSTKFKPRDKVKINSNFSLDKNAIGLEGEILGYFTNNGNIEYNVSVNNWIGMPNPAIFNFREQELDLIPNLTQGSGVYTYTIPQGFGVQSLFVERDSNIDLGYLEKLSNSQKQHICKFTKTYTGLFYKEDLCECGKGSNKRGIYE